MKFRLSVILLLFLGVIAALSAAVLTATLRAQPSSAAIYMPPPDVRILVAAKSIPAMTVLEADSIAEKTVPRDEAPDNYVSEPAQIIGKALTVPVIEGQAFSMKLFPTEGSGSHLASILPAGMRAFSVSLSDYSGLEGLLYPGCTVDVLASFDVSPSAKMGKAVSTTLLENVQVLAVESETVGASSEEKTGSSQKSKGVNRGLLVTLMVDSKQAEALQLAMEHGVISLAMRNPLDVQSIDRDATLLSEGRLARLARLLEPSVLGDEMKPLPTAYNVQETVVESAQGGEATPESKRQWTVDIIRGTAYETRSFPYPTNE